MERKAYIKTSTFITLLAACSLQCLGQTLNISRSGSTNVVSLAGTPGVSYTVQASTNFADWQNMVTFKGNVSGSHCFTNPSASQNQLFYRDYYTVDSNNLGILQIDSASPSNETVEVTDTVNNNYLGLTVLSFDLGITNGSSSLYQSSLNNVTVSIGSPIGGSGGGLGTAYLYRGSTLLAAAPVINFVATFGTILNTNAATVSPTNASYTVYPFTVKVDVMGVTPGPGFTVAASVCGPNVGLIEKTNNSQVLVQGSAKGNVITVMSVGPEFSLNTAPVMQPTIVSTDAQGNKTVQYAASFKIHAVASYPVAGKGDITFGVENSTVPMFGYDPNVLITVYKNGVSTPSSAYAIEVVNPYIPGLISAPANTIPSGDGTSFTLPESESTDMTVLFVFTVVNPGPDVYAVQLAGINWSTDDGSQYTTWFPNLDYWTTPAQ